MSKAKSKRLKQNQRKEEYNLRHQQVATVKKYVWSTAYHDRMIKEIVCTQTPSQIDTFLKSTLSIETPQVYFPSVEGWQDGLVLVTGLNFEFKTS